MKKTHKDDDDGTVHINTVYTHTHTRTHWYVCLGSNGLFEGRQNVLRDEAKNFKERWHMPVSGN